MFWGVLGDTHYLSLSLSLDDQPVKGRRVGANREGAPPQLQIPRELCWY